MLHPTGDSESRARPDGSARDAGRGHCIVAKNALRTSAHEQKRHCFKGDEMVSRSAVGRTDNRCWYF